MGHRENRRRIDTAVRLVLLGGLTGVLVWEAIASLSWSYRHDFPLLHYAAWLFEIRGAVPYRDLFEFNMPGTYLVHMGMGAVAGWDPAGVRWFDLAWLAATLFAVVLCLRRFGAIVAWAGALAVGLGYLGHGSWMTLQRDWLLMLPLLGAAALAVGPGRRRAWRSLAVGVLVGLAVSIKPHAGAALVVFVAADAMRKREGGRGVLRGFLASAAISGAGLALPVAAGLAWVWARGGLPDFWDILTGYTPLYSAMTGHHHAAPDGERWRWVAKEFVLRGRTWCVLAMAIPGFVVAARRRELPARRRAAAILASLTVLFTFYPLVAGKLWAYHFLPQETFAVTTAAILLATSLAGPAKRRWMATLAAVIVFVVAGIAGGLGPRDEAAPERPAAIAAWLREHRAPDETVQPLDWTGGAVHGMLLARAPIATRYLYDFHFYHHVSRPYARRLRASLIRDLEAARPAWVVRVTDRPWPAGEDTARVFPELEALLARDYRTATVGDGYVILERRED